MPFLPRPPLGQKILSSEITPKAFYLDRRQFLAGSAAVGVGLAGGFSLSRPAAAAAEKLTFKATDWGHDEKQTPYKDITSYNNYYEFGTSKDEPARSAGTLKPKPWSIKVDGEVGKPGTYALEDLIKPADYEERIYRHRCVEAWSMVIPWVGVTLASVLKRVEPTSKAKFVEFTTLGDPAQMPGLRIPVLDWPYVEGLRLDEAMHPLTLLAVGLYGEELPNQNGAPVRLVVPWKYGFKGAKSIVRIRLTETQPATAWNSSAPREYGFYSNVNPEVDHPRWSQKKERRIGDFFRKDTLKFNGYGDEVASLYTGMDLAKYF